MLPDTGLYQMKKTTAMREFANDFGMSKTMTVQQSVPVAFSLDE
jgi:hypothetical protein